MGKSIRDRGDASGSANPPRESYSKPRLVKLGTIYKMTGGTMQGFDDILMGGVGGSGPLSI